MTIKNIQFLALIVFFVYGCSFQSIFQKEQKFFETHVQGNPVIGFKFHETEHSILHYAITQNNDDENSQALIVFVHGTPGSWSIFGRYLVNESLLSQAQMVSIDRPGWGYSKVKDKHLRMGIEPSIAKQSDVVANLIKYLNQDIERPVIVVGFSFGVPVAMRIALDYPELIDGLMLLAGMLDPAIEAPRWYNRFTATTLGQWIVPERLKRSNLEMMAKQKYILESSKKYSNLTIPLRIIQGEKDELVYPANMDYAEKTFNPNTTKVIRIPKQGHIVVLEQTKLIFKELDELLRLVQ